MPVIDLGSVVGPQGPQGAAGATGAQGIQGNPGPNQVTDQTSTNLNGVLFGSQSKVTVKPVDSDPTADSTNLVSSGGTDKAIKARMPVYGLGKNLLDNAYFVGGGSQQGGGQLPINQRGQTSYQTAGAYGIDRWRMQEWNVTARAITINSGNIELTGSASGTCTLTIWQNIENGVKLAGKTITVSVLCGASATGRLFVRGNLNDGMYGNVPLVPSGLTKYTLTLPDSITGVSIAIGQNGSYGGSGNTDIQLLAVKLELGTEQTLCHNEGTAEAPVWVLNEVPDYEYELYRCMTSTADSSDTYANKTLATEQQLAYVESGTTATKTNGYAVGEYFCWHGLLYRAKTAIGNGDTFTVNTNCEQAYAAVPSCHLYSITFNCDSSGRHVFSDGDLPHRAVSSPVGCMARDGSNAYINTGSFDINPRYITAGTFVSISCANKEVTLFFAVYN